MKKPNNKLTDDLVKMASSTVETLVNIKDDIASHVRQQIKDALTKMDFVTKSDFQIMKKAIKDLQKEVEDLKKSLKKPAKKNVKKA